MTETQRVFSAMLSGALLTITVVLVSCRVPIDHTTAFLVFDQIYSLIGSFVAGVTLAVLAFVGECK